MVDYTMADLEGLKIDTKKAEAEPSNPTTDSVPQPLKRKRGRPKGSTNASKLLPVSEIEDGVSQFVGLLGLGVSVMNAYDGSVIIKQSDQVAKAIAGMAAKDKKMHQQLTKMLRVGSYAAVATACMPIVIGIGANHGVFPAFMLIDTGVEPTFNGGVDVDVESSVSGGDGNKPEGDAFSTIMNLPTEE